MKNKFKILDTGNFYFPFIDKGKEFVVEDTIEITLDKKSTQIIRKCFKYKEDFYLGILAESIWGALKKEINRKYKDYWFVPTYLYKLGEDYVCSIDILKKVRPKRKDKLKKT